MNRKKLVLASAIAVTIPFGSAFSQENQEKEEVVIGYKGNQDYEVKTIDSPNIMTEIAKIKSRDDVISVEKNHTQKAGSVFNPAQYSQEGNQSISTTSQFLSDEFFSSQDSWKQRTDRLRGRHSTLSGFNVASENMSRTARIGVIGSGFYNIGDLDYQQGYNFVDQNENFIESDANPECGIDKGTSLASIVGAYPDNGIGIAGMANSDIFAGRVLDCENGSLNDLAEGIRWMSASGDTSAPSLTEPVDAVVVSENWVVDEKQCPNYLQDAVDTAQDAGVEVFVGAGDESEEVESFSPANCENVNTVSSVDIEGNQSEFTNYGPQVDFSGLGEPVSTLNRDEELENRFGTSYASAIVAGVYGMLSTMEEPPEPEPLPSSSNTYQDLRSFLYNASLPFQYEGADEKIGSGIVNSEFATESYNEVELGNVPFMRHVLDSKTLCQARSFQKASNALAGTSGASLCGQIEFAPENRLGELSGDDQYVIFLVEDRDPDDFPDLRSSYPEPVEDDDPEPPEVSIFEITDESRFVASLDIETGREYGMQVCDGAGENCNSEVLEAISTIEDPMTDFCD